MKKSNMIKSATSITLLAALALTGCSATSASNASASSAISTSASSTSGTTSKVADSFSTDVKSGAKLAEDTHYSAKDLTWDSSSEVTIDLSNPTATDGVTVSDGVITITKAGNYKLTGTYDGQIKVDAADSDMVRLILNNATITNSTGAAINVVEADEVVIYTASGTTNTVSDGSSYSDTASGSPDAAIYSKSDLTLAGEGTLKVEGKYEEGIHTTDGLVIASGTLEVTAANTGIKGKDYVDILDGTITVTATKDGIKATINISGGTVTVNANGDGIDSNGTATLSGGTVIVNGPFTGGNTSLDTNGDLLLNGATVTAANSGDMFEAPSTNSTSGYVKISNVSNLSAGTTVQVTDSSGNVVANYKVANSSTTLILVSSSKITKGESYTVYTTTDSVDASSTTLASNATSLGSFTAS